MRTERLSFLDLLVLVLSIYVLAALTIDTLFELPDETSRLLQYIDFGICIVFLFDFVKRFVAAPNKWHFMRWGWVDLIASIPMLEVARWGRVLRIIRLFRVIRAFRSLHLLVGHVFQDRARGTLTSAALTATLLVLLASVAILQVEKAPDSNIRTAEDALWWVYVTITTVGYGDKFPVTAEGRLIAAVLMTAGVGMFGTLSAFMASWFIRPTERSHQPPTSLEP
jgi:voltage-gated potassium channel